MSNNPADPDLATWDRFCDRQAELHAAGVDCGDSAYQGDGTYTFAGETFTVDHTVDTVLGCTVEHWETTDALEFVAWYLQTCFDCDRDVEGFKQTVEEVQGFAADPKSAWRDVAYFLEHRSRERDRKREERRKRLKVHTAATV